MNDDQKRPPEGPEDADGGTTPVIEAGDFTEDRPSPDTVPEPALDAEEPVERALAAPELPAVDLSAGPIVQPPEAPDDAPESLAPTPRNYGLPPPLDEPKIEIPQASLAPSKVPVPSSLSAGPRAIGRKEKWATGIWYFGVILWAYITIGDYIVGIDDLPEFLGWSILAGLLVGTFLQGANRVGTVVMRKVALRAFGAFVALVFLVAFLAGSGQRSHYQGLSFLLLVIALGAVVFGALRARNHRNQGLVKQKWSWRLALCWLLFALPTVPVLLHLSESL